MKKALTVLSAVSLPMLALAQTVQTILQVVANIINILTFVVVGLALLFFLWGLAVYIFNGPGEKKDEGRQLMIWGIIALFVMVSVWGIVRVLNNTFNIGAGGGPGGIPGVGNIGFGSSGGTQVNVGVQGSSGGFWASFPWGN